MGPRTRGRRRPGVATFIMLSVAVVLALGPAVVSGATVTSAWRAKVGTAGANGLATIQGYASGTGAIVLKLAKLEPSTLLPVTLHKGTCSSVGAVLIKFPSIRSTSTGAASRTSSLTASQLSAVTAASKGTGKIAIRIGSSSLGGVKCGLFATLYAQPPPPPPPAVAATITVGRSPSGVAIAPNGIWVTNWFDKTLSRIDPATNTVVQTLPVSVSGTGGPEAITYGEGSLWVTVTAYDSTGNSTAGSLLRVDPATGQHVATIPTGRGAFDVEASPGAVWVPAYDDHTVARVDPSTNQITATIQVPGSPTGVAFGSGSLWAVNVDGMVARVDPATNQITTTVQTQTTGAFIAVAGSAVWVTNNGHQDAGDAMMTRIDSTTNQVVASVALAGDNPVAIAYGGGSLWVGDFDSPTVVQVSATTNAVLNRICVSNPVYAIAATDHAVWAVHSLKAPDANPDPPAGTVTRINFDGAPQSPLAPTPPAAPTPSPRPSPSPTPSPLAGGTLFVGTYFMLAAPAGWSVVPSSDSAKVLFDGPGVRVIVTQSVQSSLTLEGVSAQIIANLLPVAGVPEQTAAITMDGVRGQLLTYHFDVVGSHRYQLQAFCVKNGRAYEMTSNNLAGTESADRALFLSVVASFTFLSAAG